MVDKTRSCLHLYGLTEYGFGYIEFFDKKQAPNEITYATNELIYPPTHLQ